MKTTLIYTLSLGLLVATTGCSDFLEKEPPLNITEQDVFSSPERLDGAVLGLYGKIKNPFMGAKTYVCIENIGDDMVNVSGNGYEALASYEMNVGMSTQDNVDTWNAAYQAINSANTFLSSLENAKETAGNKYDQYVQEAKFVRAFCYYYLNMLYAKPYKLDNNAKSVPLRLKAENDLSGNDCPQSSVKEIFEQVLRDLSDISALPATGNTYATVTRASQAAACMLRMRCYMAMEDWDKAIAAGEAISGYALSPDIATVFSAPYYCEETIFTFPMASTNQAGMQAAVPYFHYSGSSLVLDVKSGIQGKAGYGLESDARISELTGTANSQPILKKFTDGASYLDWVPIFRYAETLLNLAECYAMTGNEEKAKSALAQVRHRSVPAASDPLDIASLSDERLKEAIYNERRAELIGEAIRALDIHRRAENFVKGQGTPKAFTVTPTTNGYIWPIPTIERAVNKLITD